MASAVSTYLSKSKKDFKPKAPLRRPGAPSSAQSSIRGSVEQQLQSQVPAPLATVSHPVLASSIHESTTNNSSSSVEERGSSVQSTPQNNASQVHVRTQPDISETNIVASPSFSVLASSTCPTEEQAFPHEHPSESEQAVTINIPSARSLLSRASPAPTSGYRSCSDGRDRIVPEDVSGTHRQSIIASGAIEGSAGQPQAQSAEPAAKRRKINPPSVSVASSQAPTTGSVITTSSSTQLDPHTERTGVPAPAAHVTAEEDILRRTKPRKAGRTAKEKGKQRSDAAGGSPNATQAGIRKKRKKRDQPDGKKRRRRASTPENAETIEIEPSVVTMADLCDDTRTGKISKREKALQARDAEELLKKHHQHEQQDETTANPIPLPSDEPPAVTDTDSPFAGSSAHVPGVRIVNGQLVLDESTRTIDRVALANEARGDGEEVVVVDSLSHKVNSATYLKGNERGKKWNEEMTDRFYDGLRMFGTDFGMISRMFPLLSRRTVKLKFTHEERVDSTRIKDTLFGEKMPVDMEAFSEMTNTVYMDPADLERHLEEDRKKLEEEQAKEKAAMDEAIRQRAADAAAEVAADEAARNETSSAKENEVQGRPGGKRSKRVKRKPPRDKPGTKTRRTNKAQGSGNKAAKSVKTAKKVART